MHRKYARVTTITTHSSTHFQKSHLLASPYPPGLFSHAYHLALLKQVHREILSSPLQALRLATCRRGDDGRGEPRLLETREKIEFEGFEEGSKILLLQVCSLHSTRTVELSPDIPSSSLVELCTYAVLSSIWKPPLPRCEGSLKEFNLMPPLRSLHVHSQPLSSQ